MAHDEKRSSGGEMQTDWVGDEDTRHRGGGAAEHMAPPGRGGGYLDICSSSESPLGDTKNRARDPRLVELETMGLPRVWTDIAERIGFDEFLETWRALEDHLKTSDDDTRRVRVPCFSMFTRFQRNRYIQSLAGTMTPEDIRKHIKQELGEDLSYRQVLRLIP